VIVDGALYGGSFAMIVLSDQYMEQHNNFKQLDRTAQGSTTSSKDNNNTSNNEHRVQS
jgi:hypothetical protein